MKIIKDFGIKQRGKYKVRYSVFFCPECKEEVIKANDIGIKAKNCGCKRHNLKHGESRCKGNTRLYAIWTGIKARCNNPNRNRYYCYGGKGIKVCEEWNNDYLKFKEWALINGYEEHLTIDRKENDRNYEPDNCRWVTKQFQARNKTTTRFNIRTIEEIRSKYKPRKYTRKMLAKEYKCSEHKISDIIYNRIWKDINI